MSQDFHKIFYGDSCNKSNQERKTNQALKEDIKNLNGMIYISGGKKFMLNDPNLDNILSEALQQEATDRLSLELECGGCCKKVSNIAFILILIIGGEGVVAVASNNNECLLVEAFCDGKLVEKQIAGLVSMPINRFCSVGPIARVASNNINCKPVKNRTYFNLNNLKDILTKRNNPGTRQDNLPLFLDIVQLACLNERLAVEFDCGDCLKKATNIASFAAFAGGFISFETPAGECIVLKTFSGGKQVDTEVFQDFLIIQEQDICSVECGAVQL
ncbi:MAG: hypothetical protein ACOY46_08105 [Bacillota bacterium]